ncbi:hypothetical protein DFH08DRAFT_946877 [Mycena albidolilacea]|uniref:Uncharacterized protein n=1 Tax=Mycena albidolilacea TaxID=1033008 RepID=A0AAD7F6A7_9AGAR|nr:hypothetical protein DFH08DRAFT_946877 [Mycena albidolilacea]
MSISMEDLCASLSSSHVGQEAMDLAALQVQLAQTLFCQSMTSSAASQRQDDRAHQPCNTPTGRTPSASFSWSPMAMVDSRRNPDHVRDEMEEDERMVEDLLIPTSPMSSPMSAKPQTPAGRSQQTSPMSQPDTSLFTTTDPFYMAQLQAAQNYGVSQPSVFSQSAFPSQQSPFIIHSSFQRHNPTQNPLSLDTHSLLMAATSSFDR